MSISTVNRIIGGSGSVRPATIRRVQEAAGEIGFYGMGVIDARRKDAMPRYRLGFLLQQSHREWYQLMAQKIREAAAQRRDDHVEPVIEFADRLDPEKSPRGCWPLARPAMRCRWSPPIIPSSARRSRP